MYCPTLSHGIDTLQKQFVVEVGLIFVESVTKPTTGAQAKCLPCMWLK